MAVYKFSEVKKPSTSRTAAVQRTAASKIITAAKARQSIIADINSRADKLSRAFTAKRQFSASDLRKIIAGIDTLGHTALRASTGTFGHLRTALRTNLATDRLVAQAEDLATVRNKLALLRTVAQTTLAADEDGNDLLQIDDSGFVMDGGDDVMDSLPDSPEADPDAQASVARRASNKRRAADINDQMSMDEEGLDGQPIGVPDESTPKTRATEPEVDNLPPGTLGPTTQSASEEDLDGQPVGVPDPAGDSNGSGSSGYSKDDLNTKAPSTTLSSRKRRAGPVADGVDLPDFLKDDGDDGSKTSNRQARQRRADDDNFEPPNGQDLDEDMPATNNPTQNSASKRRRRADTNDNAGEGVVEYSKEDPNTDAPASTVARRKRRADGTDLPVDPTQIPPVDPTQDPMLSQTGDMDDGLGDDDGIPNDDDGRDINSVDGDDDTQFPGNGDPDDDLMATGADLDDGQGGDDGIELPDDGFDDAIAGEIFSDADFTLGDGDDDGLDNAPPVDPTQLTARARQVRRASAAKGGNHTASAGAPADALKAMISQDFFS